jgi:hypothetical protein
MKIEVEVDTNDFAEQIVIQELTWHLENTGPGERIPMYSYDLKEEEKRIKRLHNAFKIVLEYYGVKK